MLYSCNTVRVCDPCRSVALYCVVSSTPNAAAAIRWDDRRPSLLPLRGAQRLHIRQRSRCYQCTPGEGMENLETGE